MNIDIFRTEADKYREAIILRERYDLSTPPEDDAAYQHIEEEILESDKYIVRVDLETAPATRATYPFYPALKGDDERTDTLFIEIRTELDGSVPYIEFKQNY
ncbi:hypothetical protein [Halomontanus rarus]|uniref:hypothetical protein n=1 Tax=Halomontanus rarus TaxID=3034020 RepID=UPI0023E8D1C4|nr:hypothetical protein [Halovivax sp. TS33]